MFTASDFNRYCNPVNLSSSFNFFFFMDSKTAKEFVKFFLHNLLEYSFLYIPVAKIKAHNQPEKAEKLLSVNAKINDKTANKKNKIYIGFFMLFFLILSEI